MLHFVWIEVYNKGVALNSCHKQIFSIIETGSGKFVFLGWLTLQQLINHIQHYFRATVSWKPKSVSCGMLGLGPYMANDVTWQMIKKKKQQWKKPILSSTWMNLILWQIVTSFSES